MKKKSRYVLLDSHVDTPDKKVELVRYVVFDSSPIAKVLVLNVEKSIERIFGRSKHFDSMQKYEMNLSIEKENQRLAEFQDC